MTADQIIKLLGLKPHPEGGYFVETFRDEVQHRGRAASTAIYFMLTANDVSRWHTVDAVEIWHHHAGCPLELTIKRPMEPPNIVVLGPDLKVGQRPQGIVPAGAWQMARPLGDWALVGCTVAPGFDFEGFVMAPAGFDPLAP